MIEQIDYNDYQTRFAKAQEYFFRERLYRITLCMTFGGLIGFFGEKLNAASFWADWYWTDLWNAYMAGASIGGYFCSLILAAWCSVDDYYERSITLITQEYTFITIRWQVTRFKILIWLWSPVTWPVLGVPWRVFRLWLWLLGQSPLHWLQAEPAPR